MDIKLRYWDRTLVLGAVVALFVCLGACTSEKYSAPSPAQRSVASSRLARTEGIAATYPWELWTPGKTLEGSSFLNRDLIAADELVQRGDRKKALEIYGKINPANLSPEEQEALALRLASMQLAFEMPQKTLATLSNYFRGAKKTEEQVEARFALVFGYAYGHKSDVDQSFAWFVRAGRDSELGAGLAQSAQEGIRDFLATLSESQLVAANAIWRNEPFVASLIGQERARRSAPGYVAAVRSGGAFWQVAEVSQVVPGSAISTVAASRNEIGVILPLAGPYGALGNATKNGIELALGVGAVNTPEAQHTIKLQVRDDGGDPFQAVVLAKELLGTGTGFILGPLLSDPARQVGDLVRQAGRSMIAFSKSTDFPTGAGVFRLGVTVESQIASLLEVCHSKLGLVRYALVYPADSAGEEYARAFYAAVQGLGIAPVYEQSYQRGEMGLFPQIARELEQSGAQAVFMPDQLQNAARFFAVVSPAGRTRIRALGTAAWDNPSEIKQSRAIMEGAIFPTPFFAESSKNSVRDFIAAYQARYGRKPDFLSAQCFDAATLAKSALQLCAPGGASPVEAMQQLGVYEGVSGTIVVRGDGELDRKLPIVEIRGTALVEVGAEGGQASADAAVQGSSVADKGGAA